MALPGTSDINLQVGLDFSKSIQSDAPRAAAELSRVFNGHFKSKAGLIEPLGKINSSTSEFAKSLEAANARVIAFGASVGIIYNIQRAFTELVKTTVDVEKKLTDINVVLGVSKGSLKTFGDQLFNIANQTGKSFSEVAEATLEFSRQGLNVTETLKRTKDALILTRIAGIDAKDSVEALTAGVNSFTKTLIDTTQIVNKFAAVDASFAVSSADLAESLKRVGSTAQDAGVDLDQLLGIVTSVQQTTSRGGAVIGNALKTIFTRISRGETIKELQNLGVAIDENQSGIEKLKALAAALNNVSVTQAAAIKEAAGGVYQINVVSAALGDLSKNYGIYEQALNKSQNATNEAINRNKELNTTLAALATQTSNNLTKAFSKIGNLTVESPFRFILDELNKNVLEPVGKLGEEGGNGLAENILKGFSKFIQGPGLIYITSVGLNLTKALVGFAFDAFKQLQNYNKGQQQILSTQQGINLLLQQDVNLHSAIISGQLKSADAQKLIISGLQQDLALRERIAAIASRIAPGVVASGIVYNRDSGTPTRKRGFFAGGMIPTATEASREISGAYDGGYVPGNVKVRNIPGIGRVVYNDKEKIKNFAGLSQPAIVPPLNSKAGKNYKKNFENIHGFSPYNKGLIPSFADGLTPSRFVRGDFESGFSGVQDQIKQSLRGILSAFKAGEIDAKQARLNIDKIGNQFALTEKGLLKSLSVFSKFKEAVNIDKNFESATGLNTRNQGKYVRSIMEGIGSVRSQSALSRGSAMNFNNAAFEYVNSRYTPKDSYEDLMGPANFNGKSNVESLNNKIESLRRKIDSYNIFGGGKAMKEARGLLKTGQIDEDTLNQFKDIRRNRLTNAAGIGSFAIPTVITPLLQQISDNKKYQAGLGLASDVTSSALTGFAISGGNPLVAAAGGAVGLLTSLPKTIEALTEPIPDLTDKIQKLQDAIAKTAQNTSEYITITEKLNAIQSGEISGVKEGDISRLAAERQKLFSQFDPQTRGLISEANKKGDISELRRIEATVNRINNTRLSGLQVLAENKNLNKNLSFQGGLKDSFTKGGLDNPILNSLVGGGSIKGPTLGRRIQRIFSNKESLNDLYREPGQGFKGNFFDFFSAFGEIQKGLSESEIKTKLDDARQRSLASKSNFSQLTDFSNIKGESLFELISKDAGAQKQIAGAQSFSDISKSLTDLAGKNDIRGVNEFLEQLKLIDPDPKSMELLNRLFKIQFSPQRIEQAIKDEQVRQVNQGKTNKLISESSINLIKFADSLERVGADLSILNSGKLIDLEKTFNFEKIKLNLENSIKGLNAGDYEKERLNLNQQNLSNRQSRDVSIEKLRADTNEALLDKIQGFTGKIQTTFVRDQIKLRENAGPQAVDLAIEETVSKLKSFFDSVGISNIDVKTFNADKSNEILESLKKFNNNTSKQDFPFLNTELFGQTGPGELFSPDQINELKVNFSELASALTSVEQKFRIQEARINQEYKAVDETTQAQFEANKKFLTASDRDRLTKLIIGNNLDLEQARRSSRFDVSEAGIRGIENFRLSNLAGPERFQEEFQVNRRRIQAEFENNSGNLARVIAGRTANAAGGTTLGAFNRGELNTKQQINEQIKQLEKRNGLDEVEEGFLKNLLNIQEQIRKEQEELNITKDKGLAISEEQLKIDQMIAKARFQEERISDNLKNIEGRIRDNKPLTAKDFGSVINNQFDYGSREFKRDAIEGVNDVSATIKSSFSGAISSIIKEGKNFGDAFKEMLIGVLNKIVDKTSDITTNLLFSGLTTAAKSLTGYANGGQVKKYSTGGTVRGGSGTKDDVPALLTEGEYIIKKSAAESIGSKILNEINYGDPEKALLKLQNEYQYNDSKYPTSGKYAFNPALSNFALTDTDLSRQNALKFERESRLLDYLEQKRQYDLNKANALKAFKDQKKNRLYGAYLSAAVGVAGAGLQTGFGGGSSKGASGGYDFNGFTNNGARTAAFGGYIKKYASGGPVFGGNSVTDNVPAMLMAGEYVIKKDRVNKLGKPFFDSLNGGVKKYADGGIVAAQSNIATPNFNNSLIVPFTSLTSAINNLNTNLSNKQTNTLTPQSNDVNNYISVSISIDGQNNTTATSSVNSQSRNDTKPDNKDNAKLLEKNFTAKMGEFLKKEMKQGGSIWTFVNTRTGR